MKKLNLFIALFVTASYCYADYTGTVATSLGDLSFSTNSGYDVVSLNSGFYTTQISDPQLPVKTISYLIPIDKMVNILYPKSLKGLKNTNAFAPSISGQTKTKSR